MLAVLAGAVVLALALLGGGDDAEPVDPAVVVEGASALLPAEDPFTWTPERDAELEGQAAFGLSHVIYARSPGGVGATARRVNVYSDLIRRSGRSADVDPEVLEAIIFLESAGRKNVIAGDGDPAGAAGVAQIVASTAKDLLGLDVNVGRSRVLSRQIELALEKKRFAKARARIKRRALFDQRFRPEVAIPAMARYMQIALDRFGREDLAIASYHMGMGNLEDVIRAYLGEQDSQAPVAQLVADSGITYTRLYFDSSPVLNSEAFELLDEFDDESAEYYFKVVASRQIMSLWREDPAELAQLASLQLRKATAEEVFHPRSKTDVFAGPDDLEAALGDGTLVALPGEAEASEVGLRVSPRLGEYADEVGVDDPSIYASLRPEALAALVYMTSQVAELNGGGTLTVTSATRDLGYQDELVNTTSTATQRYSLHTTGFSFDIERQYSSDDQAGAFQFVLDRMRALAVIDYVKEPSAIHVTVSREARALLD